MKVVDSLWFTNNKGTVGIVIAEDEVTGERKAFIGHGYGDNEREDTDVVLAWGNTLSPNALARIATQLFPSKPKQEEVTKVNEGDLENITNVPVALGPRMIVVGDEPLGTADNISILVAEATKEELEKLKAVNEIRLVKMIH